LLGIGIYTLINSGVDQSIALDIANILLTVGLNVIVTGLISGRLLYAQRQLRKSIPSASREGRIFYGGIVGTLVESAAPVAIFGVGYAVSYLFIEQNVDGKEANNVFGIGYTALAVSSFEFRASMVLILTFLSYSLSFDVSRFKGACTPVDHLSGGYWELLGE
jgi:hypothetical protein